MFVRGVAEYVKCYSSRLKYVTLRLRNREQKLSAKVQQSLLVNFEIQQWLFLITETEIVTYVGIFFILFHSLISEPINY